MSRFSTRLLLLISILVASSQARCFFTPYDFFWDSNTPYVTVTQIGYVSSFEDKWPGLVEWNELYYAPLGLYFYTADPVVRTARLADPNWHNYFKNMWVFTSAGPDRMELHQFTYPATGVSVWSTDANEVASLKATPGWTYDGISCYLPTSGTELYRHTTSDLLS